MGASIKNQNIFFQPQQHRSPREPPFQQPICKPALEDLEFDLTTGAVIDPPTSTSNLPCDLQTDFNFNICLALSNSSLGYGLSNTFTSGNVNDINGKTSVSSTSFDFPAFESSNTNNSLDLSLSDINPSPVITGHAGTSNPYGPWQTNLSSRASTDNNLAFQSPCSNNSSSFDPVPEGFLTSAPLPPSVLPASTINSNASPEPIATSTPKGISTKRSRIEKREANTAAARRYRQKRLDRTAELEAALEAVQRERDELRIKVGELEGETRVLKAFAVGNGAS